MKVYHASKMKFNGEAFIPRIPDNPLYDEDRVIPRICFSASINGCLSSINNLGVNDILYVYIADINPYFPTVEQVPDIFLFGEVWSLERVENYELYGIVRIIGYIGCEINNQVNNQFIYTMIS